MAELYTGNIFSVQKLNTENIYQIKHWVQNTEILATMWGSVPQKCRKDFFSFILETGLVKNNCKNL